MLAEASKKRSSILQNSILYNYQKKLLNSIDKDYIIAADTGTGKTIMAIYHYLRFTKGEPLLVVAPPTKITEGGWDRDIELVANTHHITIDYTILSYGVLAKKWKQYKGYFVVFDECHYVKTSTSQRGKAGKFLALNSTHFLLLSATPASNGWSDTINYFIMFGYAKNKTQFEKDYAIKEPLYRGGKPVMYGGKQMMKVVDWQHQKELKKRFDSFSISLPKSQALDLPPLVFDDVYFKKSTEYNKIRKDRVLEIDGELEAFDTLPKLQHGLRYYANQSDKLKYVEMLAEGTSENMVIFYYYQEEKDALIQRMKKLKKTVFEVSGQDTNLPKKETWSDLSNSITLVQYQAGAAAIELQYANLVVFYTPTYSFQDYDQALGRAYRNGQDKKVTVYRFITKGTVETKIYARLKQKKDFTEDLFREEIDNIE
ncbi:Superfamily II DNA/RNA helicase, SNF2 family protein [Gracilibacillus halophilus YIM-C55.5]|uniref:Superfamily II DNA/RNA helicase, SNF2 family protein n=1 Tax=Gracilibacillus halophilus YIM-C55.5 TaxID=1308866 RepID=N4WUB1_9BACI|nr:DEAD/DEAH box helicase [Gracilibacillus halophilus]ENH96701.1 Superfamily II DNA/RNA helicase, SNF2 family protein [Gracilibacillus halophilus YIM-C55.5]